ncbi:heparan-alpha-glucosaminide N-acetyltransferase domain-containing protein [Mucilaginibacter sp.]|uniref:heparan-alpha-glucosaminide N-acetyltransferase domain-containing protein n=1 Tax=Mucilaginibacter sp. TaxID=1882438 RepID=UPI003D0C579F
MLQPKRLLSIDVLRAVNMFFMIFVNDLSGVSHVPKWIDHVKANEDGMHFADTIFPLFLFIAGLSIPLAIGRRLSKGESFTSIAGYILLRSFALIVMGFFHVNMEEYNPAALLPYGWFELLLTLSFFLIWLDYPDTLSKVKKYSFISFGIGILLFLTIIYKGGSTAEPHWLQPSWWGILGIIGWAYLVCAGVYLIVKGNLILLSCALAILVGINLSIHGDLFDLKIWVIKDGASASLMMFGVVASLLYAKIIARGSYKWLWPVFTLAGLIMIALGFWVRPYTEGISKIHSTPSWVFICTGIGILLLELLIWLIDVKGRQNWFKIIKPAGTSTLTCYLIPYFMVAVFTIIHFNYPDFFNEGAGGIIRSFAVSFIVILITGFLEKRKLRLKI